MFYDVESSVEDFAVLFDFWKEGEAAEEEVKEAFEKANKGIEEAEFKSTLNDPTDALPAVLQINSGAGGTESRGKINDTLWTELSFNS